MSGTAPTTKSSSTLSTAVRGVTKNLFDDRQQVVCDRRETVVGSSARCPRQIHASLPFRQARKVLCQTVQLLISPPRLQAKLSSPLEKFNLEHISRYLIVVALSYSRLRHGTFTVFRKMAFAYQFASLSARGYVFYVLVAAFGFRAK